MRKVSKTKASNIRRRLRALLKLQKEGGMDYWEPEAFRLFDEWLDELLGDDQFGTEGQCDPRGDRR